MLLDGTIEARGKPLTIRRAKKLWMRIDAKHKGEDPFHASALSVKAELEQGGVRIVVYICGVIKVDELLTPHEKSIQAA